MIHSVSVNASICAIGGAIHDKFSYLLYFPLPFSAIKVLAADFLLTYQMSCEVKARHQWQERGKTQLSLTLFALCFICRGKIGFSLMKKTDWSQAAGVQILAPFRGYFKILRRYCQTNQSKRVCSETTS